MNQASHWQKYLDLLQCKQVPEKVQRWYVIIPSLMPDN